MILRTLCKFMAVGVLLLLLPSLQFFVFAQQTGSATTPIKHIIIVMQENHSFDNYFGTYPTANSTLSNPIATQLQGVSGIPSGVCLGSGSSCVSPHLANSSRVPDPLEGQI